jgi:hypothetical protein
MDIFAMGAQWQRLPAHSMSFCGAAPFHHSIDRAEPKPQRSSTSVDPLLWLRRLSGYLPLLQREAQRTEEHES